MFNRWVVSSIAFFWMVFGFSIVPGFAETECESVEKKKVKVEGYISKKFKKQRKAIFKEIEAVGNTRTMLRPFPMGDTAKVFAVGRCVPVAIAQHVLEKALKYTSGVDSLVVQEFLPPNWIGVGVTIFDEPSQQTVTEAQVKELLNPSLNDKEFHALYNKFSVQNETVPFFGLEVPNVKMKAD